MANGKRYIGQAQNIQTRIHEHKRRRNKGYLYSAIKKYGWENFQISVLEKVEDISKLDEREQFWLDLFKTYVVCNGYNICKIANSTRGRKHTEEEKQKIKDAIPDKSGQNNPFFGRKHSEETKAKMSASSKGIKQTKEWTDKIRATRKAKNIPLPCPPKIVIQFNLETHKTIKIWSSLSETHKNGFNISSVSQCCNGKRNLYKGFGWRFADAS